MPAPQSPPQSATQQKPATAAPANPTPPTERAPIVARVKGTGRYAGVLGGGTVTFSVKRGDDGNWRAFANEMEIGAAPRSDAAWRVIDAELKRCAHSLSTAEDDANEQAAIVAKAQEQKPGNAMFRAYKRQAQLAKEAHRTAMASAEAAKLESLGIPIGVLKSLAGLTPDVIAEAQRIVAERAAKSK